MAMRACPSGEAKSLTDVGRADSFAASRAKLEEIVVKLEGPDFRDATHSALESWLEVEGRDLIRRLMQDHLALRAAREPKRPAVLSASKVPRARRQSRVRSGPWTRSSGALTSSGSRTARHARG
jgi:hypothetical protein